MLSPFQWDSTPPGYLNSSKNTARVIREAPLLLLVCREPDEDWLINDLVSIGAAVEHICLEAVNLGLGSLWIRDTAYTEQEILSRLAVPRMELVSAIAVGYPDEAPFPRPRKPLAELTLTPTE